MIRKALMAVISVYSFALGPNLQALLALGVLACAFAFHLLMKPFVTTGPDLNKMETISLSVSFFTFLNGLVFNDPNTSERFEMFSSIAVMLAFLGSILYMGYELANEVFKWISFALEEFKSQVRRIKPVLIQSVQNLLRQAAAKVNVANPTVSEEVTREVAGAQQQEIGQNDLGPIRSFVVGIVQAETENNSQFSRH